MLIKRYFFRTATLRATLALLSGLLFLSACGSDDEKKPEQKAEKKPAYERVVILKQRFAQLENSLDEMERDLQIQRKRIESTRETAQSIKRSLMTGNLKGYTMDTVSSDPLVIMALKERQEKNAKKEIRNEAKEDADDRVFNTALILLFIAFIVVIFLIALKERKQATPYPANKPAPPDSNPAGEGAHSEPSTSVSGYQYGELRHKSDSDAPPTLKDELITPFTDETEDEDPKQ